MNVSTRFLKNCSLKPFFCNFICLRCVIDSCFFYMWALKGLLYGPKMGGVFQKKKSIEPYVKLIYFIVRPTPDHILMGIVLIGGRNMIDGFVTVHMF